jgi:hypothetical protein
MSTTINSTWQTIAIVNYTGAVATPQNYDAHGGVCLLEARQGTRELLGRKVNSTGRHREVSKAFALSADQLAQWQKLAR